MKAWLAGPVGCIAGLLLASGDAASKAVLLEDLTWIEAEQVLKPDTVIVLPLGASAKEHGPHLKLKNDWILAEYYKARVLERADVVIAPTINYHFIPRSSNIPARPRSGSKRRATSSSISFEVSRASDRSGSTFSTRAFRPCGHCERRPRCC